MVNRTSLTAVPALALAACLLTAGCSSSGGKSPATSSAAAPAGASTSSSAAAPTSAAASITIKSFAFTVSGPAAAGAMVKVTNNDGEAHTVTADSGKAFDVTIQPGKSATFAAPSKAGTYKFHCNFHSNMHGTLTVS
jgi:plastocyanin